MLFRSKDDADLEKAARAFHEKGVKQVFISLGEAGVFYSDGTQMKHLKTPKVQIVNATGAGDAFIAALALAHLKGYAIDEAAKLAAAASIIAISHENTINPTLTEEKLMNKVKEI